MITKFENRPKTVSRNLTMITVDFDHTHTIEAALAIWTITQFINSPKIINIFYEQIMEGIIYDGEDVVYDGERLVYGD